MEDNNKMPVKAERSKKGAAINPLIPLLPLEVEIAAENMLRAFSPTCKSQASLCMTRCHSVIRGGNGCSENQPPASERE